MKRNFRTGLCILLSAGMVAGSMPLGGMAAYAEESLDAVSSATTSKFSSELNFKSAKSYGGVWEDKFEAAAYTKDGGFVAVGYSFGDSEDPNWTYRSSHKVGDHSDNNAIVVKYNKSHEVEWVWNNARKGVTYFLGVDVLEDGRIVAVGRARDYESSRTALDFIVINPDNPDDYTEYVINSTSMAGYELDDISATKDGGFVVSGYSSFPEGYLSYRSGSQNEFSEKVQIWQNVDGTSSVNAKRDSKTGFNGLFIKFDKDINVEFCNLENASVTVEGASDSQYSSKFEKIRGVAVDNDGNIITVGMIQVSKYNTNAIISKWDGKSGELISRRIAGTATPLATDTMYINKSEYLSATVLNDGTYVVTGITSNDARKYKR